MIKASNNSQIDLMYNQINMLNNRDILINGETFVLISATGTDPVFPAPNTNYKNVKDATLIAYKAAPEFGDQVSAAGMSLFSSLILPGLGELGHLMETVDHLREFSEDILDDAGRRVELVFGRKEKDNNTININPKDAINPRLAFLPVTPFQFPMNPLQELWKMKRMESHDNDEEKKKKKKKAYGNMS